LKALVTGICGFAGSHLADHLLSEGEEVFGIRLPGEPTDNLEPIMERLTLVEADVTDRKSVEDLVRDVGPGAVYHLAGYSSVGEAWKNLEDVLRVNTMGLVNLVQAGRVTGSPPVLAVGSGEMYGEVPSARQPIGEDNPLSPVNPYALSKLWQEEAALFFHRAEGYPVYITRPFNHTGPRQAPRFACPDFARQLAEIEAGRKEPVLKVGNLDARRDFLDVRDVVSAYRLVLSRGRPGVPYNIASGKARTIRDILDLLIGLCRVEVRVEVEEERFRPVDISLLSGDSSRLAGETGWSPSRSLEVTLGDLLDHWRDAVGREVV
jgi:GDP-4-dehydro-6-deoxy-D-mannose reductase